jgi:hemerythrin-like metal-binding protein
MDKQQEVMAIGRLVFELTLMSSADMDVGQLLDRLFLSLGNVPAIRVRPQGVLLLFNPRRALVEVARHPTLATLELEGERKDFDGLVPEGREGAYVTTLGRERGLTLAASEDQRLVVLPLLSDAEPMGYLLLFIENDWQPDPVDLEFLNDLARVMAGLVSRCLTNEILRVRELELEEARTEAIRRLGTASELRDNETGLHVLRMANVAITIAKAMGIPEAEREKLYITAPMHDVGKIGVSDLILLKPGLLNDEERQAMQKHTEIGARILKGEDELMRTAREIARCHHEHWDGSGYPEGLSGEEIPLLARICAVADVFDALCAVRPYKDAWPLHDAVEMVHAQSGTQFDPAVVAAFDRAMPEIVRIRELYRDDIIDPGDLVELPEPAPRSDAWLQWDESLDVGIFTIDQHHRYLVDLLNDLHDAVARRLGARAVGKVLKMLRQYAQIHFRAEEQMMAHYGYAGLGKQQEQHRRFDKTVEAFYEELHVNPLTAQFDMLGFLSEWLLRHIRIEDAKLKTLIAPRS